MTLGCHIVPTEGEYPLRHIYMSVTFGTLENYRTEFLRFEVASFDYGYNAIIGRPGLAKFMGILHYTYMILKMSGPQGIITVRADFQGTAECFRVAIQAALTTKPPTTSSAQANSKPEEDLAIPANEAQAMTSMRLTKEIKRINLGTPGISAGYHANMSRLSYRNWTSVPSYLSYRLELMMVVLRSSANPRLILFISSVGRIEVTA